MQIPKYKKVTVVPLLEQRCLGYTVNVKQPAKNPAAVALGKLSAASKTPEERKEHGSKGGNIGGKARAKALTKKQRSDIAKAAAKARWAKNEG
jgi:hypothetical protein